MVIITEIGLKVIPVKGATSNSSMHVICGNTTWITTQEMREGVW